MTNKLWDYIAQEYLHGVCDVLEPERRRADVSVTRLRDVLKVDGLDLLARVENFPNTWGAELLASERVRTRQHREPDRLIDDGQGCALLIEWSVSPSSFLSQVRRDEVGPYDLILLRRSSECSVRVILGSESCVQWLEAFVLGCTEFWIIGHFDDPAEAYVVRLEPN